MITSLHSPHVEAVKALLGSRGVKARRESQTYVVESLQNIRELIDNAHQEAYEILVANRDILDDLVEVLLEKETLLKDEIEKIFKKVRLVSRRPAWTGSDLRKPSTQPPVALSPAKPQIPVIEEEERIARRPRKKATPPSE